MGTFESTTHATLVYYKEESVEPLPSLDHDV